jgi:hypothetical protein
MDGILAMYRKKSEKSNLSQDLFDKFAQFGKKARQPLPPL